MKSGGRDGERACRVEEAEGITWVDLK